MNYSIPGFSNSDAHDSICIRAIQELSSLSLNFKGCPSSIYEGHC